MSEQHNIADNRRKLYDALQHHVANIGSWDDFNRRMDDEGNRRKVYEVAQQRVANMGSWDEFNSRVYAAPTASPAQPVASQDLEGTQGTAQVPAQVAAQSPEVPHAVPTQEPWSPGVQEQIQAAEAVRVGMDAFNAGSRERMERLKRSAEPLTAEGRETRKAKAQEARSAGVATKVSGLMAPVSPVASDESVTVPADAAESQPSQSRQSPVPYGVKYIDDKPVTQWLLPDGTITTDLSEAEQAEYKARGARLRHEFEGRMKQNALAPDNPEDVAKQAQLDMQAPMRDIVAGLWSEAEDAYKADRDQASGREWDAYAHGMGGREARIVSASVDRHARDVARMKHFDLQKMSDAAWERLGRDGQARVVDRLRGLYAGASDEELASMARSLSDNAVYEYAVEKNMPSSALEYFGRTVADMNVLNSISKGIARSEAGSSGDMAAYEGAMEEYGKDHMAAKVGGTVVGMAVDPVTVLSGGAGAIAGKGALSLGGRILAKRAGISATGAGTRYLGTTLGGRILAGSAGSAANLAAYEGLKEGERQFMYGGHIDPETFVNEGYSAGEILKSAGHGAMMGAIIGNVAPLIGKGGDAAVNAVSSTAGKLAVRGAEHGVSAVVEGTIFSVPEWVDGKADAWDVWTDNMAMMLGFKASHGIKSAPRVIAGLRPIEPKDGHPLTRAERNHNRMSFEERLRKRLDASSEDLKFTAEEREELRRAGYGSLADLLRSDKTRERDGIQAETVAHSPEYDGYSAMEELMQDGRVSEAARAKAYYLLTGRQLPPSTIRSYRVVDGEDGRVYVQSLNADGGVVTSRRYKSREDARQETAALDRQIELNTIDVGERYKNDEVASKIVGAAYEDVAARSGGTWTAEGVRKAYEQAVSDQADPEKAAQMGQATKELVDAVEAAASKHVGEFDDMTPEAIRKRINEAYEVDVDAAIRKPQAERSESEQTAVRKYVEELFPRERAEAAPTAGESAVREARDSGYEITEPAAREQTMRAMRYQEERVRKLFKRDDVDDMLREELGTDDAAEVLDRLAASRFDDGERAAIADYLKARESSRAVEQRMEDDARAAMDTQRVFIDKTSHEDCHVRPATMKVDDRPVYIVKGNVVLTDDGKMINTSASDGVIYVYDPAADKVEQTSPGQLAGIGTVTTVAESHAEAERVIAQQLDRDLRAARGIIDTFNPGETYVADFGAGARRFTIAGMGEEGKVLLQIDGDGKLYSLSPEHLSQYIDHYRQSAFESKMQPVADEGHMVAGPGAAKAAEQKKSKAADAEAMPYEFGDSFRVGISGRGESQQAAVVDSEGETVTIWTPFPVTDKSEKSRTTSGYTTDLSRSELDKSVLRDDNGRPVDYVQANPEPETINTAEALNGEGKSISLQSDNQQEQNGNGPEQNNDERALARQTDGGRVADDTARGMEADRDRSDIRVYEEGVAAAYNAHTEYSERDRRDAESERLVGIAKAHGQYKSREEVRALGSVNLKRTGESEVFIDDDNRRVYKIKDPYAKSPMKGDVQPEDVIYEHLVHNKYFPETRYKFEGISDDTGDVRIVLSQGYVESIGQPTEAQIEEALAERGLTRDGKYTFSNDEISVTDVTGDNALLGADGKVYFIDPIINFKKPVAEILSGVASEAPATEVAEARQSAADGPEPMPMRQVKEKGETWEEPDYLSTTPARSHSYIYNESGLTRQEANEHVAHMAKSASEAVEKHKKRAPQIGGSIARYQKEKAEWEAAGAELQRAVEFWDAVKGEQKRVVDSEKAVRDAENAREHDEAVARFEHEQRIKAEQQAEQDAVGTNAVNPKIKAKWDGALKITGNANVHVLSDGSTISGHYVLTEAGAASASHDPADGFRPTVGFPVDANGQNVNDRDYMRDADAQRMVRSMADAFDSRALQTPVIVSRDGVVLSGNNRTMSGDMAAMQGTDKAYVDHLMQYGGMYGFSPEQIAGMKHPRVVFVPDEALPYDSATFARFNAQEMKSQSKPEAAVKLGKIVPDNVFGDIVGEISRYERLGDFYANETAASQALGALRAAGIVNDAQMPELRTGTALSAAGRELLENTLIGKVFQADPDAVRKIMEVPSMRQTVVMALSEIAANRGLSSRGYDIVDELSRAVDLCYRAKSAQPDVYVLGVPVSPFGRQHGLFDDEYGDSRVTDATTLLLADLLNDTKPSRLRNVLAVYNRGAGQAAAGSMDLFTGEVPSKETILSEINNHFINATPREQQALVDDAISERRQRAESAAEQRGGDPTTEQTAAAVPSNQGGRAAGDAREKNPVGATRDRSIDEWFGPVYTQFQGKGIEAEAYLRETCEGVAKGALTYLGLSPIDLVWGDKKAGYMKILIKHPEVAGKLQTILNECKIIEQSANRVVLESDSHKVIVSKMKGSMPTDNWLLTAYQKKEKSVSASSSDIETEPEGKRNGTATPQNGFSVGKDNTLPTEKQESTEKSSAMQALGVDTLPSKEMLARMSYDEVVQAAADYDQSIAEKYYAMIEPLESEKAELENKRRTAVEGRRLKAIDKEIVELERREEDERMAAGRYFAEEQRRRWKSGEAPRSLADMDAEVFMDEADALASGTMQRIADAEAATDTEPTEAQKAAGNYRKGHVSIDGFDVTIENPKGSVRRGTDGDGKAWETTMHNTYGYIRGTEGVDGDHIDVFLSDNPTEGAVYVVDQYRPDGSFDEHKVMYGFTSAPEAEAAYLSNYSADWAKGRKIVTTGVSKDEFKKWVESSHRKTKPFAEYKGVKSIEAQGSAPAPAEAFTAPNEATEGYELDVYETKKGRQLHRVKFPHADKEVWKERLDIAKEQFGGTSVPGGYGFKDAETAKAFAEAIQHPLSAEGLKEHTDALAESPRSAAAEHGPQVDGKRGPDPQAKAAQEARSRWFNEEDQEEAAEIIRKMKDRLKGGRLYSGVPVDVELLELGCRLGYLIMKKGARKLQEYARAMIENLGDGIRPYIKQFYNATLATEEALAGEWYKEATPMAEIAKFDMVNYLKGGPKDIVETARGHLAEQEVKSALPAAAVDVVKVLFDKLERGEPVYQVSPKVEAQLAKTPYRTAETSKRKQNQPSLFDEPYDTEPRKVETSQKNEVSLETETVPVVNAPDKLISNETQTNLRPGPGTARRAGGHESQPHESLGARQRDETARAHRRGVDRRGVVDPLSDRERGGGVSAQSEGRAPVSELPGSERKNARNNHAERGVDYAPRGDDARIKANIEAIELAKRLLDAGESATAEQMAVLRRFSGWGGLGKAFSEVGGRFNPTAAHLRKLLGEDGYNDAVMSRNSAYYTPAHVIDTMWDIARAMGFKGGRVLEGSAGIGNILGLMPPELSERSDIHAVEIDSTTGGILSLLYPDAQVYVQGFEKTRVRNGSVDLAITNVPFVSGLHVLDETGDKDLSTKFRDIHDFCIAKNIRKLREGGLGIFITSSGTMDNSRELRRWITSDGNADVVGAFRMHNKTFGGTGATSDIIVVRKRVGGRQSSHAIDVADVAGVRVVEYHPGETRKVKGQEVPIVKRLPMEYNKYFVEHPENMGGEMRFGFEEGDTYRPQSKALYTVKGKEQADLLSAWASRFADMTEDSPSVTKVEDEVTKINEQLGAGVKEGSMMLDSTGELCVARMGEAVPLELNNKKVKGHSKAECFEAYSAIKQALYAVLEYQSRHDDNAGLAPLLRDLNHAYDTFVRTYGNLHKNTAISFLRNDVDFSSILALETYSERGNERGEKIVSVGKTDIFSRRVIENEKEPQPVTVKDGILASLYKSGGVDVDYIARALGKSADEVKHEIIAGGLGFENPASGMMEVSYQYLSGNVRDKLNIARENNDDGRYDANIKALERVLPMTIPAHLIEFSLGSSWIESKLYEDFVYDKTGIRVTLTNAGGTWFMKTPWSTYNEKNRAMAVVSKMCDKTIMGHELIESAITNKAITVSKTERHYDGSTETITDKTATVECSTKVDEIRAEFKDWARGKMQADPDMSARIELVYNERFNNYVPMTIPDEYVPSHFGGQVSELHGRPFALRPHQGRAVVRATTQPVLLAHEVGTGKTYTLITTAMEMRRLGTARKPMIVVQNATVGQFVESAKEIYPNAKVLTIEEADRTADGRRNFYAKIKYNDWDMIVVPQSVFERIPDSEEREMAYVKDLIEEKMQVLKAIREADSDSRNPVVRRAEKEIDDFRVRLAELTESMSDKKKRRDEKREATTRQNVRVRAMEMLDRTVDDVENFDDMGIDAILVDECHEYKHLGFSTAMQRGVKGVDPSYSKKSQGVFLKAQAVMERNHGRNVVFATGTPISNTAAEIWTFMRYLMPADVMKGYGIYYFDDFVRNFGNIAQMVEFTTSGKFKENSRFAGYVNLPELVRIWSGVADTVLTRDAGGVSDKIPDMEGAKPRDIYLPQTRALRGVMKYVKAELDRYEDMTGKEKKENSHIPLTMYGIAKAAAVDVRLVVTDAEDDPNSKTNATIRETLRSLADSERYRGTVAIFSDNYQNKHSGFNLYEDIRSKLIAAGVRSEQIVIIKSGMTVKKKLEIFDKVNAGEIRVIMGSTFTLGTGVNIQERLHTLIHVDAPNRPMDYTQRNGRALRQGNLHKDMGIPVRIIRFGVEDSLDVTAYQRLKTKGAIADSIMNGSKMMQNSMENRVLEEEEDSFGDMTAQLSGSEYAILKNQAEREVRSLIAKQKGHDIDQIYVHNQLPKVEGFIKGAERRIALETKNLEIIGRHFPDGAIKKITVGRLTFDSVEAMDDFFKEQNAKMNEAAEAIREGADNYTSRLTVDVDGLQFEIVTTVERVMDSNGQGALSFEPERRVTYSCESLGINDVSPKGNRIKGVMQEIVRDIATGKTCRELLNRGQEQLAHYTEEQRLLLERSGKEFPYKEQLANAKERLAHYEEAMRLELAEKEAKYAEMDKTVEAVSGIDFTEEDSGMPQDGIEYRTPEEGIEYVNARSVQPWSERLDHLRFKRDELGESLSLSERREVRELGEQERAWEEKWAARHTDTDVPTGRRSRFDFYAAQYGQGGMVADIRDAEREVGPLRDRSGALVSANARDMARRALPVIARRRDDLLSDRPKYSRAGQAAIDAELADLEYMALYYQRMGEGEDVERTMPGRVEHQRMLATAREVAASLGEKVVLYEAPGDIHDTDMARLMRKRRSYGWYNPNDGTIHINVGHHTDSREIVRTVLHEVIGHKTIEEILGPERFARFIDEVWNHADGDVRAKIGRKIHRHGWDYREATKEYLGEIAEEINEKGYDSLDAEKKTVWQRIKAKIEDFLNRILEGLKIPARVHLSERDLSYMLWKLMRHQQRKAAGKPAEGDIFDKAEEIVRREEWERDGNSMEIAARSEDTEMRYTSPEPEYRPRQKPAPRNTIKVYKLVRIKEDRPGEWFPLFIDSAAPLRLGEWLDADSPDLEMLRGRETGQYLVNPQTKEVLAREEVYRLHPELRSMSRGHDTKYPSVDAINYATDNGLRWMEIEETDKAQRRFDGENRRYWNLGINGSGSVSTFSMRPGWHAGSLPTMRQIGKGKNKDLRDDNFVWVEGEVSADVDYQAEAERNPDKDLPDRIPEDGFYMKATNANKTTSQADRVGWYVAGSFKANRFISDAEARQIIDDFNAAHPDMAPVAYDYDRESGRTYDPEAGLHFRDGDDMRDMTIEERTLKLAVMLADRHSGDVAVRDAAVEALGKTIGNIRKAMGTQHTYDFNTVRSLSAVADILISSGTFQPEGHGEIKRLYGIMKRGIGHAYTDKAGVEHVAQSEKDFNEAVESLMDLFVDNQLKVSERFLADVMKIRGSKVNARGVEVMGELDVEGQIMVRGLKDYMEMDIQTIRSRIETLDEQIANGNEAASMTAAAEKMGVQLAEQYVEEVADRDAQERIMRDELRDKSAWDPAMSGVARKAYSEHKRALRESIRKIRIERAEAMRQLASQIGNELRGSIERVKAFREREKERIEAIHHNANSDMTGRPYDEHGMKKKGIGVKLSNNMVSRLLLAPAATFEQIMRVFGSKSVDGEGYLYDRFVRGWQECRDKGWTSTQAVEEILNDKAAEILGKRNARWSDLYALTRKAAGSCDWWDGGEIREHKVTQGNLMYMYMVNKMTDGQVKLRRMCITEDIMSVIEDTLDPRLKEVADWLQSDLLPNLRNKYNEVHMRMFGAPMAEIENYFPLKILANARLEEVEMAGKIDGKDLPKTMTGSIIKRRYNNYALDVLNSDAVSVALDHIREMETWAAFAEYRRDLCTLLSYKHFRNQVKNMSTLYGSGEKFWDKFYDLSLLVGGAYQPKTSEFDKVAVNITKLATGACIAIRLNTALKQLLSYPAFAPDANLARLMYNVTPWRARACWKWAMVNMPAFQRRWQSRQAGNDILRAWKHDWDWTRTDFVQKVQRAGITPNAFIDALTVAMGSEAIYQSKLKGYLKDGFSRDEAHRRAVQDAEILFNLSQQSSELPYLSLLQNDRSYLTTCITNFRNSPMSYLRQSIQSKRELANMVKGKDVQIEFETKKGVREGLTPEQAKARAERKYKRNWVRNFFKSTTFDYILPALWAFGLSGMWYCIFGDDDEKKKQYAEDAMKRGMLGGLEGFTFGGTMPDFMYGLATGDKPQLDEETSPAMGLITDMANLYSNGKTERAANEMINTMIALGVGVNPQVLEDGVVAGMDFFGQDEKIARDWALLFMRVLSCPQSQMDQVYFDELGMDAREAQSKSPAELAERYATYKARRANFATLWAYDDDRWQSEVKATWRKKFETEAKKRLKGFSESDVNDRLEGYDAEWTETGKRLKRLLTEPGDTIGRAERYRALYESGPGQRRILYEDLHPYLDKMIKSWLTAPTAEDAAKEAAAIVEYKAKVVEMLDASDDREKSLKLRREAMAIALDWEKRQQPQKSGAVSQ